MPGPPRLADLQQLAERALEHAQGDAQVTATWRRDRLAVEVTCVLDGRAAAAVAGTPDEDGLRRAAKAAAVRARRPRAWPSAGLPEPQQQRPHDLDPSAPAPHEQRPHGLDPSAPAPQEQRPDDVNPPAPVPAFPDAAGVDLSVEIVETRVAVASTRGVRAAERRRGAIATAVAGAARLRAAAPSAQDLPLEALVREAQALLGEPVAAPAPGEVEVVLGPDAVAALLDHLRPAFGVELDLGSGPLHGRFGTRVAAAAVNLADAPRSPLTLGRSFDAEGVPTRPVVLIANGVARGRVHDTASAQRHGTRSTGHASRAAAPAPIPEHLVLAGGGAAGLQELCAPIGHGLFVATLSPAREADGDAFLHTTCGAALIRDGELTGPVSATRLRVEPLAVLGGVTALGVRSRTVPLGAGAAEVPALRSFARLV